MTIPTEIHMMSTIWGSPTIVWSYEEVRFNIRTVQREPSCHIPVTRANISTVPYVLPSTERSELRRQRQQTLLQLKRIGGTLGHGRLVSNERTSHRQRLDHLTSVSHEGEKRFRNLSTTQSLSEPRRFQRLRMSHSLFTTQLRSWPGARMSTCKLNDAH